MFRVVQFCSSDITHSKQKPFSKRKVRPIPNMSENPWWVMVSHSAAGALFSTLREACLFQVQQEASYSLTLKLVSQISCAMQMY